MTDDIKRLLKKSQTEIVKADALAEHAHMNISGYDYGDTTGILTADQKKLLKETLGYLDAAREELSDAHYCIEKILGRAS